MIVLADHHMGGHAVVLWGALASEGWLDLLSLSLITFADIGLAHNASDREVWRFVQANGMLLLTGNRSMKDADSLETTIREENKPTSLPVITITRIDRLSQKAYRTRCVRRLTEIIADIDNYMGTGRIYIP